MAGAGMLHPNVLKNAGLDPEKIQGFAFGPGLERHMMVKYGIRTCAFFTRAISVSITLLKINSYESR